MASLQPYTLYSDVSRHACVPILNINSEFNLFDQLSLPTSVVKSECFIACVFLCRDFSFLCSGTFS